MFGRLLVKGTMFIANVVVVVLLLITMLASVVSPAIFVIPAFTSLLLPVIILLNVFFVFFWIIARKWYFLISLLLLIFAGNQVRAVIPLHLGKTIENHDQHAFKVLSYNTMMFGMLKKHTVESPNKVIEQILLTNADIICLQEFGVSPKSTGEYLTQKDIDKIFKSYPYKHIVYNSEDNWRKSGIATFSKYPIVNKRNLSVGKEYGMSLYSDIKIGNDTIRMFNNHLESNRLTESDRHLPIELKDSFNSQKLSWITRLLSRKLFLAYKIRARQADRVAEQIKLSPYKVLVCGDFNDVPGSYTYTKIKGKMDDAFAETGLGLGWTYNLSIYKFRIDFMFYQPEHFKSDELEIDKVKYSDHYPIHVKYSIIKHS